jgi:AcrR family transcriptional regulator
MGMTSSGIGPGADKREVILAAALELFSERGYAATAVPLIAEHAGVGAGTIYRYFESKEGVVTALWRTWTERLSRRVLDGFPLDAPPRDQLAAFVGRLAAFVAENPRAFAFLELHDPRPFVDERALAPDDRLRELAVQIIEAHRRRGAIADLPPELLVSVIHGACVGVLRAARTGHLAATPELLDATVRCLWEGIGGLPEPADRSGREVRDPRSS